MLRNRFTASIPMTLCTVLSISMSAALLATLLATLPATLSAADSASWPQWRGQHQNGVAPSGSYPKKWSESASVRWKVALSGKGGSTPVIADSKAFITAGLDGENTIVALDVSTGDEVWTTSIGEDRGNKHRKGSGSNPSPVTDGTHVFVYFRSGDLACLNLDGSIQWQVNLQDKFGEDTLWWDLGSSPTLIGDLVVVAVMQSGPSYLVAFDRSSGKQAWKVDRMLGAPEEAAQSYATPIAIEDGNMIAVMGADNLTIHSATDGRQLGRVDGFNPDNDRFFRSISSPVVSGDFIVCPYSRGATVTVCRISDVVKGKGRESIVWHRDDLGSDVPTPAVQNGRVYVVGDSRKTGKLGVLEAVELETGSTLWKVDLPRSRNGYSSSPLIAGNHLYVVGEDAKTYVVGPLDAKQPGVVEVNEVNDSDVFTVASPVPVEGGLLIRTRNSLYRVGS